MSMNKDGEVKGMLMNDNRNSKGDKKHLESWKNRASRWNSFFQTRSVRKATDAERWDVLKVLVCDHK